MNTVDCRALTFNVFHDYPRCRHLERRLSILEDALASERPDVAILQEISASRMFGQLAGMLVDRLRAKGLRYEYHYAPANGSLARGEVFEEGSAILSRWPIRDTAVRRLAEDVTIEREYHGYRYVEYRIAVAATLAFPIGGEIEIVGAHLTDAPPVSTTAGPRHSQVDDLVRFVRERCAGQRRALVGGDFNAPPDSAELRVLREMGFEDVCEGRDPGPTNDPDDRDLESPHDTARHRIDHLLIGPGPGAVRIRETRLFLGAPVEIGPGRHLWASDHNGILADLRIEP